MKSIHFLFLSLILIFSITGCEKPSSIRKYTEVFVDAPKKQGLPFDEQHKLLDKMPNDDIHANLNLDSMNMQTMGNPQLQNDLQASVDKSPLSWRIPEGWTEASGNGMRLATITSSDQSNPVEVTIVALGGSAGGLEANILRWMGQLKLENPTPTDLNAFINRQVQLKTISNLTATLIDLTEWQKQAPDDSPSMIAAIIDKENSQIFIKMTGKKSAVIHQKDNFKSIVLSIKVNE